MQTKLLDRVKYLTYLATLFYAFSASADPLPIAHYCVDGAQTNYESIYDTYPNLLIRDFINFPDSVWGGTGWGLNVFNPVVPGVMTEYSDGTADITAQIADERDPLAIFDASLHLSGRTNIAPPSSPKYELRAQYYSTATPPGPVDISNFYYFTNSLSLFYSN